MEQQKLLSIVVPTLNRCNLLLTTLPLLVEQIERRSAFVQLLVIDNASDDQSAAFVQRMAESHPILEFLQFADRVDIDGSFERCVLNSTGKFVNIFGDDDIPLPGYVDTLVAALSTDTSRGIVYVNRLIGNVLLDHVSEIAHVETTFGQYELTTEDFIKKYTHWPGFITCLTFSRNCWNKGAKFQVSSFSGYKFLAQIYFGAAEQRCLFVGAPLVIQRRGIQTWKSEWPRYWLVSMPRLLSTLEEDGITTGALDTWRRKEISMKKLAIDCLVAKAYGYSRSNVFWTEAAKYQLKRNKWVIILFRNFLPTKLAAFIYFKFGKYREN